MKTNIRTPTLFLYAVKSKYIVLAIYFGTFTISKYVILAVFWAVRTNERRSQFSVFSVFGAIGIYANLPLYNSTVNELYLM
jgi:hypothetical protein